jgi:hypothetical protein
MGMVRAIQQGEDIKASAAVREAAKNMSPKLVEEFASTPEKGLPERAGTKNPPQNKKGYKLKSNIPW